jgi:hypothetical protein
MFQNADPTLTGIIVVIAVAAVLFEGYFMLRR